MGGVSLDRFLSDEELARMAFYLILIASVFQPCFSHAITQRLQ